MKTLRMIFEFFSKNKIPTIIMVATFIVVLFIANNSFGVYRYVVYTKEIFLNTETPDSLYCMPNINEGEMLNSDSDDPWGDFVDKIEQGAKKYKAYTPFSRIKNLNNTEFNGTRISSYFFSPEMIEKYQLKLSSGSWSDMKDQNQDKDCFNVIVSGVNFDYLNIGDTAEIEWNNNRRSEKTYVKIKVVGKLAEPNIIPTFRASGTNVNSTYLYQKLDGLIFMESERLSKTLEKAGNNFTTVSNFMTAYKNGSSQQEKDEYLQYFKETFSVADYNTIISDSNDVIDLSLRRKLPTPIFLLAITTVSLISLSVLFVNKKLREHSIYYLCGCNRGKSYFIISCAVAMMGLLGGLLNILFIANYDFLTTNGIVNMRDGLIYDEYSMLFTILYALAVSLVSVVISLLIFRKSSPIEIYRKFET